MKDFFHKLFTDIIVLGFLTAVFLIGMEAMRVAKDPKKEIARAVVAIEDFKQPINNTIDSARANRNK